MKRKYMHQYLQIFFNFIKSKLKKFVNRDESKLENFSKSAIKNISRSGY